MLLFLNLLWVSSVLFSPELIRRKVVWVILKLIKQNFFVLFLTLYFFLCFVRKHKCFTKNLHILSRSCMAYFNINYLLLKIGHPFYYMNHGSLNLWWELLPLYRPVFRKRINVPSVCLRRIGQSCHTRSTFFTLRFPNRKGFQQLGRFISC